jgi:hypothetical protein
LGKEVEDVTTQETELLMPSIFGEINMMSGFLPQRHKGAKSSSQAFFLTFLKLVKDSNFVVTT